MLTEGKNRMRPLAKFRHTLVAAYYSRLARVLQAAPIDAISPNTITVISTGIACAAAVCYAIGHITGGGLLLLLSGFADTLDGTVARLTHKTSRFGALLDSSLDRVAEFFIFFGLLIYFRHQWVIYAVMLALMGSIMVSYVKARAESLGAVRTAGLMQRPERIIVLSAGSLLNTPIGKYIPKYPDGVLVATIVIIAVLSTVTIIQRLRAGGNNFSSTNIPSSEPSD